MRVWYLDTFKRYQDQKFSLDYSLKNEQAKISFITYNSNRNTHKYIDSLKKKEKIPI